jgi:hypothetical protein
MMSLKYSNLLDFPRSALFSMGLFFSLIFFNAESRAESKAASITPFPDNPASGAFLQQSSASLKITPISIDDVKLRYVGSETIAKKNESPLSFADIRTGVVFKPSRRWGLGIGEILPPVSVERKITSIPIVVLNQVNFVDLKVNASVKYGFSFFGHYLLNDRLGLGLGIAGRKIDVKAEGTSQGSKLFDGSFVLTDNKLSVGLNYDASPNRLRIGLSALVYASNGISAKIDTPLASGAQGGGLKGTDQTSNKFMSEFLMGVEFQVNPLLTIYSDGLWRRADPSQEEFSIVDLVSKKKDIHDTLSYFGALSYMVRPSQFGLATFTYEPSPIGPGSKGEGGLSGFGMKETILLYSGFGDLLPAWSLGAGYQYGEELPTQDDTGRAGRPGKGRSDKVKKLERTSLKDRITFSIGVRYRRASLGVDLDGELPGAYSQTKLQFPISLKTIF